MAEAGRRDGNGQNGRDEEWLPLGPASRLLGVNADSLRRWADAGQVDCITTPGGHRRFSRSSLEAMLEPRPALAARPMPRGLPPRELAASARLVAAAYHRSYVASAEGPPTPLAGPAGAIAPLDRDAFRVDGRRLVAALLRSLESPDAEGRADAEAEAMGIAGTHARRLADAHVPLAEAVRLFVRARRPFLAEIRAIARRGHLEPAAVLALYEDASALLDRLLIAFVAAHAEPAASSRRSTS